MTGFKRGKRTELHKTGPPPKCHDCGRLLPSSAPRVQAEGVRLRCGLTSAGSSPRSRCIAQSGQHHTPQDETLPGL